MPTVKVKGVLNPMQFPDDMDIRDIKAFLQKKFYQQAVDGTSDILTSRPDIATTYEPTLMEKASKGIASALQKTGLISDNYRAQEIGRNITSIGEFLPVIGDASAGDDFGRAAAQGDKLGMAMAGLGVIPIAGDTAKQALRKAKTINLPSGKSGSDQYKMIKQSDPKAKAKTNTDGTVSVTYLEEYQPKQLKGPLYEFDPDALELSEGTFKNTDTYKGDKNSPITVTKQDGDYVILDGHHRAKLAKQDGRNVKAVVLPIEDVAKMKKDNIHQADMRKEWIARGYYKPEPLNQSLPITGDAVKKASEILKVKFPDLKIGLRESADNIILDKVIVPEELRNLGKGTEFMNELILDADSKGKSIGLTPSSDFGGNKNKLTEFYKRFGFVENKGRNKDYAISELMYREPKNKR